MRLEEGLFVLPGTEVDAGGTTEDGEAGSGVQAGLLRLGS